MAENDTASSRENNNGLPSVNDSLSLDENFKVFFKWALELENPLAFVEENISLENRRRHAVGFDVYYLEKSPLYTVRLHHYPTAGEIEKDMHDHAFNSLSGILAGTLIETEYDIKQSEDGEEAYYCFDDASGEQKIEESDEKYNVQVANVKEFVRGEVFDLNPGKIHSVAVKDNTISLMVKTTSKAFQKALVIK